MYSDHYNNKTAQYQNGSHAIEIKYNYGSELPGHLENLNR